MLYAIVDIETTGGHASANEITEVAINIHDGVQIIERYQTLINPLRPIPLHITALTGINDDMVADAPSFDQVASTIAALLQGKTFIAHNVNFDYSFLKHQLALSGFVLDSKKLCTVRMSRKIIPGHSSYSLGKLCSALNIPIVNRHRAAGDADATTILFEMLLKLDTEDHITGMIKKTSKEQQLPPNLQKKDVTDLPDAPGVYYFKDNKGKIIYVGKAINIRKRVVSHFTGHTSGKQRQEFLKHIYSIDHVICGTELMALILEATEIKRYWPENNRAMKRYEHKYDLYTFEDQNGFLRLAIDKHSKVNKSLRSFNNLLDGYNYLNQLVNQYELCPKLCYLQKTKDQCSNVALTTCKGACIGNENAEAYNERLSLALDEIQAGLPSFALIDNGRNPEEYSCLLVDNGKFYGMGYLSKDETVSNDMDILKSQLEPCHSNNYIINLVLNHADRHPRKIIMLKSAPVYNDMEENFFEMV